MERYREIERSIIKKYRKTLWRPFIRGIQDYDLIREGDRIAVCISGGKDSMLMAKLLQELKRHGKFPFELVFLVMDPGYNQRNRRRIEENAELLGIPVTVFESDIFDVVVDIRESPCYLCARMRRGFLYAHAKELGCNKIALGHHFDDVIETILMGMLYGGQMQTMMPKLHSTNFPGMELIRPMYLVHEEAILDWVRYHDLHFLQCACRFTEQYEVDENGANHSKRQEMKELIARFRMISPLIEKNIFRSVENVNLNTIISYHKGEEHHHFLDDYDKE
ncbi:MAG: tRNA 2-thiocytidine biosynthesis protein TtcA [Lachnospiraceae bacterium]|nr:tRNA 2-thiocytidine biosynthesis protein TtcA [Lachnospiraceae bacterium]